MVQSFPYENCLQSIRNEHRLWMTEHEIQSLDSAHQFCRLLGLANAQESASMQQYLHDLVQTRSQHYLKDVPGQ